MSSLLPFVRLPGVPAALRLLHGLAFWLWSSRTLLLKLWCTVDLCFYLLLAGIFAVHHMRKMWGGQHTPALAKKLLAP